MVKLANDVLYLLIRCEFKNQKGKLFSQNINILNKNN